MADISNQTQYRYLDLITGLFVAVLLISNIASTKIVQIWRFTFDGGTILFPLSYIFGDILTEVYGYSKGRRVIWIGFFSALLMALTLGIISILKPAPGWALSGSFHKNPWPDAANCNCIADCIFLRGILKLFCTCQNKDTYQGQDALGKDNRFNRDW